MKCYTTALVVLFAVNGSLDGGEPTRSTRAKNHAVIIDPFAADPYVSAKPAPQEKVSHRWLLGTAITLKPRKTTYFLGENVLLDYTISYKGDGRLSVWNPHGLRSEYCHLVVTEEAGKRVPQSTLNYDEGGSGDSVLRRGQSATLTIPLMRFCRLEKPGVYRVRAAFDLGWSKGDYSQQGAMDIPENDPRWTETSIVLVMPDAAQSRQVVEHMHRMRVNAQDHRVGCWEPPDYADFTCLQYPVYLPILMELVTGKDGDEKALTGIAHVPTVEATQALVRLLKHPNKAFALQAAGALNDRLPEPQPAKRGERTNPVELKDADPELVKHTWRGDLATPVRQFAVGVLSESGPTPLRCGAFMLEAVGTAEDIPALTAALDRSILVMEGAKAKSPEEFDPQPISPARQSFADLVRAVAALAARGAQPPPNPSTSGEIIHFLLAIAERNDFRPSGWEKWWGDWVGHGSPYVREVALFNSPRPLPESLHEQSQTGLRTLIAATKEPSVVFRAAQVAFDQKIPADEILGMLVDRLDSPALFRYLYAFMADILRTGKPEQLWWYCMPDPTQAQAVSAKTAWKRFLKENGQAIREGKRFYLGDFETVPGIPMPEPEAPDTGQVTRPNK